MAEPATLQDICGQTPAQLWRVKKATLIKILLGIPEDSRILQELANDVKEMNKKIDEFRIEQVETSLKVIELVTENVLLKNRITKIEKARRITEQRSYIYDLEVSGIAGDNDADDEHKCVELFNEMGAEVSVDDIDACHKIPTRRKNCKKANRCRV